MEGKLTGIGVGPGDPELLTLKAVRAITESDILILPGRSRDGCYAYRIVQKALPEVAEKEFMLADFPMMKDKEVLKAAWEKTAEEICRLIDETPCLSGLQRRFYKEILALRKERIIDYSLQRLQERERSMLPGHTKKPSRDTER